jgi:DNA replication protein DnaC
VTIDDITTMFTRRKAYAAARPPAGSWERTTAPPPPKDLRLKADDIFTKSGWTLREVQAVSIPGGAGPDEVLEVLFGHWLPIWAAEDAKEHANREAAQARHALWLSQAPERDRIAREKAREQRTQARRARWVSDGPPGKLGSIRLGDLAVETEQQRRASAVVANAMLEDDPQTLFLLGTPGTGKSSYAALWLRQLFDLDMGVRWVTAFDFDEAARGRGDDDLLDDCQSAYGLVVDDIDVDLSDRAQTVLAELVDRRKDEGLRTCITTNLTKDQLKEMFTPRNHSRLAGGAVWIPLTGRDYRMDPVKVSP